jgi:L-aminopeptidase/D-esterase-like protein
MDKAVKGGIGSSSLQLPGGAVVAAIAAVNPYGSVVDYQSGRLVAGPQREGTPRFHDTIELLIRNEAKNENQLMGNTTIGVIATNSFLTCEQANLMAQLSQDGLALAIRPCHTMRDGDTMFAMSTGHHKEPADMTALGAAAVEVTAQAVLRAVRSAEGLGGIPAINELHHN